MSILTAIQYVCGRLNVPSPQTVLGNTDTQIVQMLRLLEEEGNDLAQRHDWATLTWEVTHTTVANENQGFMATIATHNFRHIKNGTFWDRTNKLPILGPLSDQEWQMAKALSSTSAQYRYRLRTNNLLSVIPVPPASLTWVFEYVSKNWVATSDFVTAKQYITLDSDTTFLPEELLIAGLRWRWKAEKGFDYAQDFETYEEQVKTAMARDGGKRTICMDGDDRQARPGIVVPDQSWSL